MSPKVFFVIKVAGLLGKNFLKKDIGLKIQNSCNGEKKIYLSKIIQDHSHNGRMKTQEVTELLRNRLIYFVR